MSELSTYDKAAFDRVVKELADGFAGIAMATERCNAAMREAFAALLPHVRLADLRRQAKIKGRPGWRSKAILRIANQRTNS